MERDLEDVSECLETLLSDEAGASPDTLAPHMPGTECSALGWLGGDMLTREAEARPEPRGPINADGTLTSSYVVMLWNRDSAESEVQSLLCPFPVAL